MRSESSRGLLLSLLLAIPGLAASPSLPEWARVVVRATSSVEVGRSVSLEVSLEAPLGGVEASAPSVEPGPGLRALRAPSPAGLQLATPAAPARWSLRARIAPTPDGAPSRITVTIPSRLPREELEAAVRETYAAGPQRESLLALLQDLPDRHALTGFLVMDVDDNEGLMPGAPQVFRRYLRVAGARLALWDPPQSAGAPAAREALETAGPRLRALLLQAGVRPGRAGVDQYRAALERLQAARPEPDEGAGLARLTVEAEARDDGVLASAARTLLAAVLHYQGSSDAARRELEVLVSDPLLGRYACYNLGELHRVDGDAAAAAREYREALRLRPVYTAARRRLMELGNEGNE